MSQAGSSVSGEVLIAALPGLAGYWWGRGEEGLDCAPLLYGSVFLVWALLGGDGGVSPWTLQRPGRTVPRG